MLCAAHLVVRVLRAQALMLRYYDAALRFLDRDERVRPSPAPLETPSHNGPYRGPAPVLTLAPGVMGSDLPAGPARRARLRSLRKGRENRWREQIRKRIARETGAEKRKREANGANENASSTT